MSSGGNAASISGRPPSVAAGGSGRTTPRPEVDGSEHSWHGGVGAGLQPPTHRGRGKRRVASMESLPRGDAQLDPQAALLLGSPHDPASGSGGGGGGWPRSSDEQPEPGSPRGEPQPSSRRSCLMQEPLLLFTLVGMLVGVAVGIALKPAHLGKEALDLIGFPGELMLRLLKMLVLPLVSVSMVSGVCSLRQQGSASDGGGGGGDVRRLARLTAAFYIGSTALAILVGILLVVAVHPGRGAPFDRIAAGAGGGGGGGGDCCAARQKEVAQHAAGAQQEEQRGRGSTAEALLGVARLVVPDNIVAAAANMNVLGIITFSLMFGLALSSLGPAADGLIKTIGVLNAAVGRMVTAALWVSPLGIASLIAASILRACDLLGTLAALGLWVATVLTGLALFACGILPLLLWAVTGRSPLAVARHFAQALLMAFGTSSSAASLPLAMQSAKELGCDEATVAFFLPLGTTVNMNGTALYEATTAIFIAQAHGVHLGAADLLAVALTASLAAVGAPAIPSAGLVTMLVVLQAVSLDRYASDLAAILAIDWLLDRVRTSVNLLGDAYGCVMVDHLLQQRPHGRHHSQAGGPGGAGAQGLGAGSSSKQAAIPYIRLEMGLQEQLAA